MKYINLKQVMAIISAGFMLVTVSGCKKEEQNYSNISESVLSQSAQIESTNEESEYIETIPAKIPNTIKNNETEVIIYFEELEAQVDECLDESNFYNLKEKVRIIVITSIDFIFYGTEINGVTFEELTGEAKNKIMATVSSIDDKIETKIPSYKETIKDNFGKGYDYVSGKLDEALAYADGFLERQYETEYDIIKDKTFDITDNFKEETINIYENISEEAFEGWSKIKDWYETKTNRG